MRGRTWTSFVAMVSAASLACACSAHASAERSRSNGAATSGRASVSVVASAARKGDVGIYLNGLGTVTSLNTVTVRSRVDGQLLDVAFGEGQAVRKGDLLARVDPRPFEVQLAQAEGQSSKDRAALQDAQLDLRRYQILYKEDSIPKQQLDSQAAAVDQFVAALKSDQGQIDAAKLNLTYSRITAPISGRVGLRLVDPGNIIHAADENGIVVITQVHPIAVLFTIPQDSLPAVLQQIRAGRHLDVDIQDHALTTTLATGTLQSVDNQIDPATGSVKLKAIVPNTGEALFPNQFVNARLLVDTARNVVIVPTAAIQRGPQSVFVYLVKPDNTVEVRNVEVQLTEGDNTVIRSGVSPGDVVVTEGVDKLQPGTTVSVRR